VPFTLVHAGEYTTEDKLKIQAVHKLNTTQSEKKQATQNTAKQNYPGLITFYNTRPGNEVGLFYNAPEPTWGGQTDGNSEGWIIRNHNACSGSELP